MEATQIGLNRKVVFSEEDLVVHSGIVFIRIPYLARFG